MARTKPALDFAGSLEVEIQAPLDARTVVPTKADLTLASNFPYAYEGLLVYVEEEKKHYTLIGSDTTVLANWQESGGSGEGNTVSVELTQAEYNALSDEEKNNGTVYFITDGRGGGAGMTQTVLWESATNVGNVEQELSKSIDDYDSLYVQCRYKWLDTNDVRSTVVIDVKQIKYGQTQMYSTGATTGGFVYFRFKDDTHFQQVTQNEYYVEKVIGITFGSSLDGTIGRWEKIVELQGSEIPTTQTIDFSEYNVITITSVAPFGEVNECFTTVKDFTVGRRLTTSYFDLNPDQNRTVTIERTGEDTISISNANGMGICIYGYKETGLSNADVKRVANEVGNVVSVPSGGTTGQVLTKKTDADGDTEWKDGGSPLPDGGTTGQFLVKKSNTSQDVEWAFPDGNLTASTTQVGVYTDSDGYKHNVYKMIVHEKNIQFTNNQFTFNVRLSGALAIHGVDYILSCNLMLREPEAQTTYYHPLPGRVYESETNVNREVAVNFKRSMSGSGMLITIKTECVITQLGSGTDLSGSDLVGEILYFTGPYS